MVERGEQLGQVPTALEAAEVAHHTARYLSRLGRKVRCSERYHCQLRVRAVVEKAATADVLKNIALKASLLKGKTGAGGEVFSTTAYQAGALPFLKPCYFSGLGFPVWNLGFINRPLFIELLIQLLAECLQSGWRIKRIKVDD